MEKLRSLWANKFVKSFAFALLAGLVFRLTTATKYSDDSEYLEAFWENYQVYAVPLPQAMSFAGEEVPLLDFEVRERIDREILVNTYYQSQTLLYFKRANRWFPIIEKILKEEGVPDDFKYLAVIESGLSNAISPAAAVGFWQFLKGTALENGLEVSDEIDERYHVEKSTRAACRYLKKAYAEFGSWSMVAAAYNMGLGGLRGQVKLQQLEDYHSLYLNPETARYLPRLLAVKAIMENPKKYGYRFREQHLYKPLKTVTVTVDTPITDLVAFAKSQGSDYKFLKLLNPWLRKSYLPNKSKKAYQIQFPHPDMFVAGEELKPQYQLPPAEEKLEAVAIPPVEVKYRELKHTVKKGEDLRAIAELFEVKAADIVRWNKLESTDLVKGQTLLIQIAEPLEAPAVQP